MTAGRGIRVEVGNRVGDGEVGLTRSELVCTQEVERERKGVGEGAEDERRGEGRADTPQGREMSEQDRGRTLCPVQVKARDICCCRAV